MDQATVHEQRKLRKSLVGWLIFLVCLYLVLGWFDNATELRPDHDNVLQLCFAIAGLSALFLCVLTIPKSKGITVWRRAALTLGLSILAFLYGFVVSSRAANIIEGLIDFPPSQTKTYPALLSISRAYQTHGKGRSWNIQTTPIWSNLEITEDDYGFMLAHRRAGDATRDPDDISSNGYFCAQVTMQQSGSALRIMHAGSHRLPKGSVVICSSGAGN